MNLLDVHYYDGHLEWLYSKLKNDMLSKTIMSLDDSVAEIKLSISNSILNNLKKSIALNILDKLYSQDTENYDTINRIHIHNLLPLIWTKIHNLDDIVKNCFIEQLIDINSGLCPQGRVARLLQFALI